MEMLPVALLGIGMNEFMLLVVLALVVIGPKRLPEVARGIGKMLAQFRRATTDLREAVSTEINAQPGLKELKEIRDEIGGDMRSMQDRARDYMNREFEAEQQALDAVERDAHGVANNIGATVRKAGEETAADGEAEAPKTEGAAAEGSQAEGGAESSVDPTEGKEPWNVQMNKLFFRDKIDSGEMTPTGDKTADSPEDEYVAERDGPAAENPDTVAATGAPETGSQEAEPAAEPASRENG